jgi:hypothetical protein
MIKSKAYQLFTTLNKQEIRRFEKHLLQLNNNEFILLFKFITSISKPSLETLKKEKAYPYIYKSKNYNDLKIRHLLSDFLEILENFIYLNQASENKFNKLLQLIKHTKIFNLTLSEKYQKELEDELNKEKIKTPDYYHTLYQKEVESEVLFSEQARSSEINYQALLDSLDNYFIIEKLKTACLAVSHKNIIKTNYDIKFIEAVIDSIEKNYIDQNLLAKTYYQAYKLLTEFNEINYLELKQLFFNNTQLFNLAESKALLTILVNFCIKQINNLTLREKYVQECFSLYEFGLNNNFLLSNNKLSRYTFKNIVSICILQKKIRLGREFYT